MIQTGPAKTALDVDRKKSPALISGQESSGMFKMPLFLQAAFQALQFSVTGRSPSSRDGRLERRYQYSHDSRLR